MKNQLLDLDKNIKELLEKKIKEFFKKEGYEGPYAEPTLHGILFHEDAVQCRVTWHKPENPIGQHMANMSFWIDYDELNKKNSDDVDNNRFDVVTARKILNNSSKVNKRIYDSKLYKDNKEAIDRINELFIEALTAGEKSLLVTITPENPYGKYIVPNPKKGLFRSKKILNFDEITELKRFYTECGFKFKFTSMIIDDYVQFRIAP